MFQQNTASLVVVAMCALAGCSNDVALPPASNPTPTANGATATTPEKVLTVVIQKGSVDDYETESVKSTPNPTAAQIEEAVRAQDWQNAERRPHVGLGRTTAQQINVMRVHGLLGAMDAELALHAEWLGAEGEQDFSRRSPPLKSIDEAVQLLLAFHADDPQLSSMAEWTLKTTE